MPEINHHSQRVSALLGKPPGWLLRWGTAVIFLVVAALLLGAAFVRYPDVIAAPVVVSGSNPPQNLLAQKSGRFAQFLAADGSAVRKGEIVAVLENEANYRHVTKVDSALATFKTRWQETDTLLPGHDWPALQLGDVQPAYQNLKMAYTELAQFYSQRAYPMQIAAVKAQLTNYHLFYKRSWQQRTALQAQYDLAAQRYYSDSLLAEDGVYAAQELSKRKEQLLQLEYNLRGARAALAQSKVQMAELEKNISDLTLAMHRERENKTLALTNALSALQTALQKWQFAFAFVAEVDGQLAYQTLWAVNQNVASGQHVFTIQPQTNNTLNVQMLVPPMRLAKVGKGQRVQVKLDAYPFEEYGMLVGQVAKLNTSPIRDAEGNVFYVAQIALDREAKTTYGFSLHELDELTGTGEIITEELSLLERVFYSIRKLLTG